MKIYITDVVRRLNRATEAAYTKREQGCTLPQLAVLRALSEDGAMCQTQLTEKTGIDRSTLGVMLDLMQANFLVKRTGGIDARTKMIALSPDGRRTVRRAERALVAAERQVLAALGNGDRLVLDRIMLALAGSLSAEPPRRVSMGLGIR